ncbi:MAG: succinylglutamate desuccinylase/aspartoacylase family protein [Patescibacteria group bacterium]
METKNQIIEEIGNHIWKVESGKPGHVFVVSGGIHGNEKTGAAVVRMIKEGLEQGSLSVQEGVWYFLHGNLEAMKLDERYTESHVDLNRCFTDNLTGEDRQSYEGMRAQEIMDAIAIEQYPYNSVVGIDIHSTNHPSIPFLVSQKNPGLLHVHVLPHLATAQALLCDPDLIFEGELLTTDEYYARRGLGLCYESGHADDLSRVDVIYNEIIAVGKAIGVVVAPEDVVTLVSQAPHPIYTLREAIILTDKGFEYAPGVGVENFKPYSAGDILGYHGSEPVMAPSNGVFLFPKLKKHWKVGKPLGYITECPSP